jgi:iron complex outermembrane receptor protein
MANVQSVEVLKGPGAILYGALEPGGIVYVITKLPQSTAYYSVQQQIGSYGFYRTTVDTTGPLTKDGALLYRLDMSYENDGSFVDFGYTRNLFFAPVLKWNIDPRTQVTLELEYHDNHFGQNYGFTPLVYGHPLYNSRSLNYGERSPAQEETLFSALSWSHEFDNDWSVKQQFLMNRDKFTAEQFQASNIANPTFVGPFGPYNFASSTGSLVVRDAFPFSNKTDVYSTVIDVTGHFNTGELKHTLLLGGDYYRYNYRAALSMDPLLTGDSLIGLFDPIHPGTPLGITMPVGGFATQVDNIGLYAQDQIKLPYGFEVMGGVRYQNLNQRQQRTDNSLCGPFGVGPFGLPPLVSYCTLDFLFVGKQAAEKAQAMTPRVGLLWRPKEWLSLYGNYTEGFSPNLGKYTHEQTIVPPSQANQWEGGVKVELFEGRLRATAAYYHLVKTNIPTKDPTDPSNPTYLVAGEARSQGPELDIQGEILPGWKVIAAYANTDVKYTKSNDPTHPVGTRFEMVPRNTVRLWNTYDFQQDALKGFKVGAGYTFHGSAPAWNFSGQAYPALQFPTSAYQVPSYGTVDLMAAYEFKLDATKITAQLNITNFLDRKYWNEIEVVQAPTAPLDYQKRLYGEPRVFKGSLKAEF